jgi:hypothetical protein
MSVLKREAAPVPAIRQEVVAFAPVGADVIVRSRTMADELILGRFRYRDVKPVPGETESDAHTRNGIEVVAATLHLQVVLEDGEPLWSTEQWMAYGARHPGDVFALYQVAERVSGADPEAAAKN